MSNLQQEHRRLQIVTSSAFLNNSLLVQVNGKERFSQSFHYECVLYSTELTLTGKDILGTSFVGKLMQGQSDTLELARYVNGLITRLTIADLEFYDMGTSKVQVRKYIITLNPVFTLLQQSKHNRVFQAKGQKASDIVEQVLTLYNIDYDISKLSNKAKKEYCLQYQESDFDFVCRMLSELGAYFYFKQTDKKCTMVIADKSNAYNTNNVKLAYFSDTLLNEQVKSCYYSTDYVAGKFTTGDFVFEKPSQAVKSDMAIKSNVASTKQAASLVSYINEADLQTSSDAKTLLQSYVEHQEAQAVTITAEITCAVSVADIISFTGPYFKQQNMNKVVVTSLNLATSDVRGLTPHVNFEQEPEVTATIEVIPSDTLWRPKKLTTTINPGMQLATVVNAKGTTDSSQPLYFDELGRVCIKFMWEGYQGVGVEANKFDQCMVSMIHHWDNGLYRVGTSVIVDFINNDPDKPVIIGAVNTGDSLPLGKYSPETATQSVISRMQGTQTGDYNSIKFDDKNDKQALTITAISDLITTAKKETFNSEETSRKVEKNYQLEADKEKYTSKGMQRDVDGDYQVTSKNEKYKSDSVERKISGKYDLSATDIHIKGNFVLDGNLIVKGTVDVQ